MNNINPYGIPTDGVIAIAGTVGVGKSTLTQALADHLQFRTSFERVVDNPYLESFYQDFSRWSFHLQVYFLAERFHEQKRIFEYGGGFIQDRSIYEDTDIFARMHYEQGTMSEIDYLTYRNLFDAMVKTPYFPHPNLLIYLDGDFDRILNRLTIRGRQMEKETPIDYWRNLHDRYSTWVDQFNFCPVLRVDIHEYDLLNNPESIMDIATKAGKILSALH